RMTRPIPRHALEDRCIPFILSNLQACSEKCQHSRHGHAEADFLPTRLIDVRGAKLAIIETTSLAAASSRAGRDSRYLTLSYCWGNPEQAKSQLKLSSVSEDRLKREFLFGDMSPIQQDAVALTRTLGVPYLWIDALCIRQGDAADWARESSQMHRIYAGSYATICALASASCQEGFLTRGRNPFTITLPYAGVYYPEDDLRRPSTFEIGHSAIYSDDTPSHGEVVVSEIESSRWSSRGWTFQEGIMSTRTIYFSRLGLIFACSQGTKTELGNEVRTEDNDDARFMLDRISNPSSSRADLYDLWNGQVVLGYSRRELTSPTNALPALSGLAQRFAAALTGDQYVAGMWSGDLIKGLSWSAENRPHKTLSGLTRALEQPSAAYYIAPSWSWAGRGPISFFTTGDRSLDPWLGWKSPTIRSECDNLATATVPQGVDRFGQISHGELSLTAHAFPLGSIAAYSDEARRDNSPIGEYVCHREEDGISVMFMCYLDWEPSGDQEDWARNLMLVMTGSVETAAEKSGRYRAFVETDPCGLIVHPIKAGDAYLRVGTFDRAERGILTGFLKRTLRRISGFR
ncbi:heterokaryon incompatibility protein-domain-containing protein, partial [Parachaetomium inaequale]